MDVIMAQLVGNRESITQQASVRRNDDREICRTVYKQTARLLWIFEESIFNTNSPPQALHQR